MRAKCTGHRAQWVFRMERKLEKERETGIERERVKLGELHMKYMGNIVVVSTEQQGEHMRACCP